MYNHIKGHRKCLDCGALYPIWSTVLDSNKCPECKSYNTKEVKDGK